MPFDFGKNWLDFSRNVLTSAKVKQAENDFAKLFAGIELTGKTFIDIGFGQGLSLLIARQNGATVVGCELNLTCKAALEQTLIHFPHVKSTDIPIVIGSILNQDTVNQLLKYSNNQGFDIVHSWGVLHHTGNMRQAFQSVAKLVKKDGYLVIAIYNKHWTSPIWLIIKWLYCKLPSLLQLGLVYLFYPIIWLAKYLVTRKNPTQKTRGMDFLYDVVDWVGGYPYEYASIEEIEKLMMNLGFQKLKHVKAQVPTGCNEFIFMKNSPLIEK